MSEHSNADAPLRDKVDDDDHDLLTFGEAGERLRIEIAALTKQLGALEASGDAAAIREVTARLTALRAAATRNAANPINDANFEKFFGYAGKARPNLSRPAPSD